MALRGADSPGQHARRAACSSSPLLAGPTCVWQVAHKQAAGVSDARLSLCLHHRRARRSARLLPAAALIPAAALCFAVAAAAARLCIRQISISVFRLRCAAAAIACRHSQRRQSV